MSSTPRSMGTRRARECAPARQYIVTRWPRSTNRGAISLNAVSKPEISRSGWSPRNPNIPMRSDPLTLLIRPPAARHRGKGARQNSEIERERPVLDVVSIQANDFLEVDDVAAPAH